MMLNAALYVHSGPLVAVSWYATPLVSMLRSVNVAMPPTALTVVVPERTAPGVPVPVLIWIVTGNVLENVIIEVDDQTGGDKPIIIRDNVMHNSTIEHKQGNLLTDAPPQ